MTIPTAARQAVRGRARGELRLLERSLTPDEASWLEQFPVKRLLDILDTGPENVRDSWVTAHAEQWIEGVRDLGGDQWIGRYLRLFLLVVISRGPAERARFVLPRSIADLAD